MIKITDLEKVYRTEEVETVALNKMALEVNEREFVAITGPHFNTGKSPMNRENFRVSQTFSKLSKSVFLLALFCYLTNAALAQDTPESKETKFFPAQFSIYYPFATHGGRSTDYAFNFSLNLVYGKIGGLNGVEVSGLVGLVEGDVNGVQIAGIGNGAGNMKGIQVGGLFSASGNMSGIQLGGLFSAAGDMQGIQTGGLFSAADNMQGIQIGGLFGAAADVKGIQIGGLFGAADNVQGIQLGGLFNAADDIDGLQISGIFNFSNTLRGIQIGLVSVNDTIEKGFSLSLVNIVKRGFYREWELSFSDYANVALSYKMGMQRFYTIYSVGANFIKDDLWSFGVGFGNRASLGSRFDFRPELVSYNYFPMNFKNLQSTFATHLKFGFVYNISEKFGLSFTPSVYVMNSNRKSDKEHYKVSPFEAFYTSEKGNKRTTMGVGVSLGLSLR